MLNLKRLVGSVAFSVHCAVRQEVTVYWLTGMSLAVPAGPRCMLLRLPKMSQAFSWCSATGQR